MAAGTDGKTGALFSLRQRGRLPHSSQRGWRSDGSAFLAPTVQAAPSPRRPDDPAAQQLRTAAQPAWSPCSGGAAMARTERPTRSPRSGGAGSSLAPAAQRRQKAARPACFCCSGSVAAAQQKASVGGEPRFQASFIVAASIVGLSCPGREIIETFISYLSKIVMLEQYIGVQSLTPCSLLFAKWNLRRQKSQNRLQIFCRQIFCSQETLKFTKQPSASLH